MGPADRGDKKDNGALGGEQRGRSPSASEPNAGSLHEGPLPTNGRWSTRRKSEVVIRMLRGEPIDALSREMGVEVYRLEEWRDKALFGMEAGLKERECDPLRLELDRALKKVGELSIKNELLEREKEIVTRRPLPRRRPRN
jgi:transposase